MSDTPPVVNAPEPTIPAVVEKPEGGDTTPPAPIVEVPKDTPAVVVPDDTLPGEKTPPHLLLKSLQEERDKVTKLEGELKIAKENGGASSPEVQQLQSQINDLNETLAVRDVVDANPVLKGKEADFKEFRKSYPGVSIEAAAKLYVSEKGLGSTARKGLEQHTGGTREVPKQGYTAEDIADLRKNNWKLYQKLLREGKIVVQS